VMFIEAGFPIASDGDFEAVKSISASLRRPVIAALARASMGDVLSAHGRRCRERRIRASTSSLRPLTYI